MDPEPYFRGGCFFRGGGRDHLVIAERPAFAGKVIRPYVYFRADCFPKRRYKDYLGCVSYPRTFAVRKERKLIKPPGDNIDSLINNSFVEQVYRVTPGMHLAVFMLLIDKPGVNYSPM